MKKIFLEGKYGSVIGNYALVDDEDYEWLNQFRWYISISQRGNSKRPSKMTKNKDGKRCPITMGRFLLKIKDKNNIVGYKNSNGLDCRKENLIILNKKEYAQRQSKQYNNTSGFKGVYWKKHNQKYQAQIGFNYKVIHLGYFDTPEEAAKAYDKKALELYGKYAKLNFPIKSRRKYEQLNGK